MARTRCLAVLLVALSATGCADRGDDDRASKRNEARLRAATPVELVSLRPSIEGKDAYDAAARVIDLRLDAEDVLHSIGVLDDRLVVHAVGIDDERLDELMLSPGLLSFVDWTPVGNSIYRSADVAIEALGPRADELDTGELRLVRGDPDAMQGWGVTLAPGGKFDRADGAFAVLDDPPAITDAHVLGAVVEEGADDAPVVAIGFNDAGARRFEQLTRRAAERGEELGVPQRFAIIVGDEVVSIPQLDYREYPDGIAGRYTQISGLRDEDEANDVAALIAAGPLPFELVRRGDG